MKHSTKRILFALFQLFAALFGFYIFIQVLIKVFGGSWASENLIVSMLMGGLALLFTLLFSVSKISSDLKHHSSQFKALATDFKQLRRDFFSLSAESKQTSKDISKILMKIE